mmetsp:Transcript_40529/g.95275  ORF Transcript_40529/g.95275 Transcript_40529/m.95275 type:complete len:214 (+) Transcript_40529:443-1084(+)
MALARPLVIDVDMKHIFLEKGSSRSSTTRTFLISSLSPVNKASLAKTSTTSMRRQSAGTPSPVFSSTKSPGTISIASISCGDPSRMTVHFGAAMAASFSKASPALFSWYVARQAFKLTMNKMTNTSTHSCTTAMATAAIKSRRTTGEVNCNKKILITESRFSFSRQFLPYCFCKFGISDDLKPFSPVLYFWNSSSLVKPDHGFLAAMSDVAVL